MITAQYTFSQNTSAPPNSKQARLDANTWGAVTRVWLTYLTNENVDIFYVLQSLAVDGRLILQDENDHTIGAELTITTTPVDRGGYFEIGVTAAALFGGMFGNNQNIRAIYLEPAAAAPPPPDGGDTGGTGAPFIRAPWQTPQAVSSVLVAGPLEEPLTLEEAKLRAGLTWTSPDPRDALIEGFIAAARQQVELDTGLALITQTREITIAIPAYGPIPLPMHATPLQSIVELSAQPSRLAGTRLWLDPRIHLRLAPHTVQFVDWAAEWGAATYRIVAGWADRATLQRQAPLLVQAVGLLAAHYATLGRDLASVDEAQPVPMGYEAAIAPHRLMWVP